MKRIISLAISVVMLLSLVGMTSCKKDSFSGREPVVSTESFTVTQGMFAYYMNVTMSSYEASFEGLGIDPAKSLKSQECPYVLKGEKTWFNYFVEMTKEELATTLALCQEAHNAGMTLSDEEQKNIDSYIAEIAAAAKNYGTSLDEYVSLVVGNPFDAASLRKCLEMDSLAAKYADEFYSNLTFTDEEAEEYYQSHRDVYDTLDICAYTTLIDEDNLTLANQEAEQLAQTENADEYFALVRQFIYADFEKNEVEVTDEVEDMIDTYIYSCVYRGMTPEDFHTEESAEWAKTAKVGETFIERTDEAVTVFMINRELSRDESHHRNVRHVLFSNDTYINDTIPSRVYSEWGEDGYSEESIIKLAAEYSQDEGSSSNGGLYDNVAYGDMTAEFNDWLFDESREVGDHGIIETEYGWHLMYYVGENSIPQWKSDVFSDAAYDMYSEMLDKYYFTFEYDSEVIAGIDA